MIKKYILFQCHSTHNLRLPTPILKYIKDLHDYTSDLIRTQLKQSTQHTDNREGKEKVTFQVGTELV